MTDLGAMARDLRRSVELSDPVRLCHALGLNEGAKRQSGGLIVCCPAHGDRTPSCSVTVGPDGTVRVKCFSCDFSADALGLIEQTLGCQSFAETIDAACDISGCDRPSDTKARFWVPPRPADGVSRPPAPYPWSADVERFWGSLGPVTGHPAADPLLRLRAIDPAAVDAMCLARVVTGITALPQWARYRGGEDNPRSWAETGHVLILPTYDAEAKLRSVRAWRIVDNDTPKRLPPAGCRASGLVLANDWALSLLRGEIGPTRIVIAEGEGDYLVHATRFSGPVIGIGSGAWSREIAERIPVGSVLIIRTDRDDAGHRYAKEIAKSCEGKCQIRRAA